MPFTSFYTSHKFSCNRVILTQFIYQIHQLKQSQIEIAGSFIRYLKVSLLSNWQGPEFPQLKVRPLQRQCSVANRKFLFSQGCCFAELGCGFWLKQLHMATPARTPSMRGVKSRVLMTSLLSLKMTVKSSLKFILKFTEPLQRYLLSCQANLAILGRYFCTGQQQL